MCDKALDKCHLVFDCVPDQHNMQEMCDKIAPKDLFKLKYWHDTYKAQKMYNKTVNNIL